MPDCDLMPFQKSNQVWEEQMNDDLGECSYLVVDDDAIVCQAIASVLTHIGCRETFFTSDSDEAFTFASLKKPDFVLLDIHMPEVDGWSLMKQMRQVSPNSIFVLVTSSTQLADLKQSVDSCAHGYCIKPVLPYTLPDILTNARRNRVRMCS